MKKFGIIGAGVLLLLIAGGVLAFLATNKTTNTSNNPSLVTNEKVGNSPAGKCQPGEVDLPNYGDKGKRLANCFVEYPGEPSRQDKSYYVIEDICGQFTKEFVQNALGKPVTSIKKPDNDRLFNCTYYLNDKDYVMLVFEYLKIANQKTGQERMGRTAEELPSIPMRNLAVWQENKVLNSLYLVFGDEKFLSIKRNEGNPMTAEEIVSFAANMAKEIKNYK